MPVVAKSLLLAGIVLLASCVVPMKEHLDYFGFGQALEAEFMGTGRNHGHVADGMFRNKGAEQAKVLIPAGTVLDPGGGAALQSYVLWNDVAFRVGPGASVRKRLEGGCLTPARKAWPRGEAAKKARLVRLKEWTREGEEGKRARGADAKMVAVLSVCGDHYDQATESPAYKKPQIPDADESVRQWTLNLTVGGQSKQDLLAALEREMPDRSAQQREAVAEEVVAAAQVVLQEGGKEAATAEGLDFSALDLTIKP